ncbi:paired immunoglobulin-like type 2 receptor beta [Lethenteron reissneri]|uniref:paired immunoglobulin-like type 2 receptor beta n=1 Tax=Lethenteron reissneri TaxID=7753 RepID=UPI002AB6E670|nr:paired immunoglobulin-like type 2 receptor beta [Lethenteron reissneri]
MHVQCPVYEAACAGLCQTSRLVRRERGMGWGCRSTIPATVLVLLLLHAAHAAGGGAGEICTEGNGYNVCVARTVEAAEGGSATLPCRFTFPENVNLSRISVAWRIDNFHGNFTFNNTGNPTFISKLFTNRLALVGDPHKREASLEITNVRRSDQNKYFCRIMLHTLLEKIVFQIIPGTDLIIKGTTASPGSIATAGTTQSPLVPETAAAAFPTATVAAISALGGLLLVAACAAALVFLWRRRARGVQSAPCTVEPRREVRNEEQERSPRIRRSPGRFSTPSCSTEDLGQRQQLQQPGQECPQWRTAQWCMHASACSGGEMRTSHKPD